VKRGFEEEVTSQSTSQKDPVRVASFISSMLTQLVHLHSDPLALRAPPFSILVVDVPFEFLHGDFAALAGHALLFVIALP
jgi:hypothetical protein